MRYVRFITFVSTFAVIALASQQAFAQKIRTYGAEAEAAYGAPQAAPAAAPAAAQPAAAAPAADGEAPPDDTSVITVFKPGGSNAPLPVDLSPDKMYRGVIPGTRDEVSHLTKARDKASDRSNRNAVTWVGFQANPNATRVFFQTGRESSYDLSEAGGALKVTFSDTKLSARNFGRFIDTSFFNRNVTRIEVKQVNKTTVVATISLRQFEQPDVDRNGNYLYLDFSGATSSAAASDASAEE